MVRTTSILKNIKSITKIKIACWILKNPEGLNVSELVNLTKYKRTNVSKQINEMKKAGLLESKKEGRKNIFFFSEYLHKTQIKMIQEIANSFHEVDEKKGNNNE